MSGDVPPQSSNNGSSYVTFVNSFLPSYRRSSVVFSFSSTSCFNLAVSVERKEGEGVTSYYTIGRQLYK